MSIIPLHHSNGYRHGRIGDLRNARRQYQSDHLRQCGWRCILEALIAVERGEPLDVVLDDFARIAPEGFHAALYYATALDDGCAA